MTPRGSANPRANRRRWSPDTRRVLLAQALRAGGYGFAAVLLGSTLETRGFSPTNVGVVLAAVLAGSVVASLALARWADRWGRRRSYVALYVLLALTGAVFAEANAVWLLAGVALLGALSTEVVESGPFTSLEQAMLASDLTGRERIRGFGVYNAVAAASGSLGALAAALPDAALRMWPGGPTPQRWFWLLVPIALAGALVAWTLSPDVEAPRAGEVAVVGVGRGLANEGEPPRPTARAGPVIRRLAVLFALDSFGGGFVVQAFVAYYLTARFGASTATVGGVFATVGVIQTFSFLAAVPLANRFGLLPTMVFSHLPSNGLLVLLAFAPSLPVALALVVSHAALSKMDVPTRQAYLMALVEPSERTAAAAYTNTVRYIVRPIGPLVAGTVASISLGAPFVVAGTIKATYDLILWRWFRRVPLPEETGVVG